MIPVVFVHWGASDYLPISMRQAMRLNESVILLTDQPNGSNPIKNFSSLAHQFEPLYWHMSGNPKEFELRCIQRWMVIWEYMTTYDLGSVFVCDSDVLIYGDLSEIEAGLRQYYAAYCVLEDQPIYRWSATAHTSFWTRQALKDFCDYVFAMYSTDSVKRLAEKWSWHQRTGRPGGVCDMSLLYLFAQEHLIANLAKETSGSAFDQNINVAENYRPDEYEMEDGIKLIEWRGDVPFGIQRGTGKRVRFNALHFQGGAKVLMLQYARLA